MKKLGLVILLVGLLILALILTEQQQWARVSIAFGDARSSTNFAVLILVVIGVFIGLRLLAALVSLPARLIQAKRKRRITRLRESFEQGMSLYLQGRWEQAQKDFLKAAQDASLTHVANLLAARCAMEDSLFDKARTSLQVAREANIKDDFCVLLAQSEMLIKLGQVEQAIEHLNTLRQRQPDNRKIVNLLIQSCEILGDWEILADSLPKLRKLYASQPDKLRAIEVPIARVLLQQSVRRAGKSALEKQWREIDSAIKPQLFVTYAKLLVQLGAYQDAERVLREAIESHWGKDCLVYYGDMEGDSINQRIQHAERWLKTNPNDPSLLLCLGKLYRQLEAWDRAKYYLRRSFSIAPQQEDCKELLSVLDYLEGDMHDQI